MTPEELSTKLSNKNIEVNNLKQISKELERVLELFFTDYIKNDEEYIEKGKKIIKHLNAYINQL